MMTRGARKALGPALGMLLAAGVASAAPAGIPQQQARPICEFLDGRTVLTNATIVAALATGCTTESVVAAIQVGVPNFALDSAGMRDLRRAGVPDPVIAAMRRANDEAARKNARSFRPPETFLVPPQTPRRRFSVKIGGGASTVAVGDYKTYYNSFTADYLADWNPSGGLSTPRVSVNAGVDLVYHLTRSFGVGVGVGYIRANKISSWGTTWDGGSEYDTTTLTLSAIPVRFGVYYFAELGSKLEGYLSFTPAYYRASVRELDNYRSQDVVQGAYTQNFTRDVKASRFGMEGTVGLRYQLGSKISLYGEIGARSAEIQSLKGSYSATASDSWSENYQGTLYYYRSLNTWNNKWVSYVGVERTWPPTTATRVDVREATVSFSGVALAAGIMIAF